MSNSSNLTNNKKRKNFKELIRERGMKSELSVKKE
jgi:hypothetical protein